jgi:soluble lytic murein transglycosylase
MILRRLFIIFGLAAANVVCALPKIAPPPPKTSAADDALLRAYDAFKAGDVAKLQRAAAQVRAGTLLAPYLDYWRLRLRLEDAALDPEVRAFLGEQAKTYLADRLRGEWLKELAKRGDWQSFELEYPPLLQEDSELRCYAWLGRLVRGDDSAYDEAKAVWFEPRDLSEGCGRVADRLLEAGRIGVEDVWRRARILFEAGQVAAARRTLASLPQAEAVDDRLLHQAGSAPKKLLSALPKGMEKRATRETVILAAVRLARGEPEAVAELMRGRLGAALEAKDQKYLWGRVAYEAARRLVPEAISWYTLADPAALNDEQLAWRARSALRAGDWETVKDSIDRMSVSARQDPAWTYWYGRALGAQGRADGAQAYFTKISGQPTFYGLLAAEELGYMVAVPQPYHTPAESEIEAARANAGLTRALELYRLDLRSEATREWLFTIRGMDDAQLLAAAELARRAGVFDRAINTADRTAHVHNYKFRFLAPFKEIFAEQSRAFGLEEAWMLGLVRQESRFIANARSPVGAMGLMQLMPATARWSAKKIGVAYQPARVIEPPTNIALGANYLKHVLDDLGHPVLASAAYNAGPGRARRWRDAARPLEGAIYAETIPFSETRDYVKKVMANTMYYAQLIGGKLIPLKDRLGKVPARSSGERVDEDLP